MKNRLASILNKPAAVSIVSLIIAGAIGTFAYIHINQPATPFFISGPETPNSPSSLDHLTLSFLSAGKIKSVSVKVGDTVQKDMVLADLEPESTLGQLTEAQASFAAAQANYQKVLNGASSPAINAARSAVATGKTNLEQVTNQQNILVENARRKLYSDDLVAESDDDTRRNIVPTISGAYNGTEAGQYELYFGDFNIYNGDQISYSGLEKGIAERSDLPKPLGTRGLDVAFPDVAYNLQDRWTINIPNKNGANYPSNLNAYNSAIQTKDQAIAAAKSALDQANSNLELVAAAARPEDAAAGKAAVDSALGALQIAEAAYKSRMITAPGDGVVTAVYIKAGEVASPNAPAIELSNVTIH